MTGVGGLQMEANVNALIPTKDHPGRGGLIASAVLEGISMEGTTPHHLPLPQWASFQGTRPGIPTTQPNSRPYRRPLMARNLNQVTDRKNNRRASGAATPSNTGRRPETQDGDTPVQDCGVPPREFERAQIGEINQNLARVPLTPSATMDADDTEKRRRGFETSGHSKQVELVQLAQPPTQTVVLRSVGKKEVGAYTGKEIKEAIERAGIQTTDQILSVLDKLLKVTEIRKGDEVHPLQPYKALSGNQCRGIIYLKGEGNDVAPESLATDICSRTNTVVAARPLGRKGNTILVTFEGRPLPRKVSYMNEVLNVNEYRPRPLVCFQCHGLWHKKDVCPKNITRCGSCGFVHDGMEECSQTHKCINCGGAHLGTSNDCPKRAIPPRKPAKRTEASQQRGQEPESNGAASTPQNTGMSYAAAAMRTQQPTVIPAFMPQESEALKYNVRSLNERLTQVETQLADNNARGKNIKKACVAAHLQLCNNPETPTRLAQSTNQNDTSPDLTWSDPMGSDHPPIVIKLHISTTPRRRTTFTKWDTYRAAMSRQYGVPFAERIQSALKGARREYQVKEDTPTPDLHLVKLWDKRLAVLIRYRARRSLGNKIRLNHATAEAKKYTIELCRTTWRGLSSSTDMQLCVEGTPITPTDNIKILGVPFNKNRRASTWITQVKKHWKDGLDLLRAITSKAWGAQEDLLRHLVRTLLVSKVVYGLNVLRLTRKQEATLVTVNRAAMRIVTGLPRFTRVEKLECVAQMNTIREIAGEMRISQAQRLSRTPQGRIILTKSGRARLIEGPLMPTPPPPWETEAVVVAKPIPKNQGHNAPGRRVTQASIHLAEVGGLEGHVEVFYTDAARSETGRTAIAWHTPTRNDTQQQFRETTRSVCSAELRALLMAVRAATQKRTDVTETRIYTDSQEALRELRRTDTCNPTIAEIRAMVRQAKAHQAISVTWLPGHEGIPGNVRANRAVRAALQARSLSQGPVPSSVQREAPQDDFDLSEVKRAEKTARKARLTALLYRPTLIRSRAAFHGGSGWH
ncbi:hypothetical protein HPB47_003235 [Ixodes persulcatus]|uniref:Uncharacterized protein n=1 Tax=Ixodes persulcatus TaxID=34615 RepID=A0AC60PIZ2_IXOPE|nr:hypothetical protein HPB47_003235 [Ixodes persulcatus]